MLYFVGHFFFFALGFCLHFIQLRGEKQKKNVLIIETFISFRIHIFFLKVRIVSTNQIIKTLKMSSCNCDREKKNKICAEILRKLLSFILLLDSKFES